jgi:hypothetical protein
MYMEGPDGLSSLPSKLKFVWERAATKFHWLVVAKVSVSPQHRLSACPPFRDPKAMSLRFFGPATSESAVHAWRSAL